MATISAEKFSEKVSRATDSKLEAKKRNGMLGSIVGDLKALTQGSIADLTPDELDDRFNALHFAEPLFAQLKPELVAQVKNYQAAAEAIINKEVSVAEALPTPAAVVEVVEQLQEVDEVDAMAAAVATGEAVALTATPEERAAATEVVAQPIKAPTTKGEKKKGKPVDPNSGRQQIIRVLRDNGLPMTPNEIKKQLEAEKIEVKYISSHLNYFKAHGQVIHGIDKRYSLPATAYDQVPSVVTTETTVVVEPVAELVVTPITEEIQNVEQVEAETSTQ
jgi:hypothetical protein